MSWGGRQVWRAVALIAVAVLGGAAGFALRATTARPPAAESADVGFLQDMIDHHEQAILMSSIALRNDVSPQVRTMAVDIVAAQRYEIGMMEGWLRRWGHGRGRVGRAAMGWMGHPKPVAEMEGMASEAELRRLNAASGGELDAMFFDLMARHHEGGIDMSDRAIEAAKDHDVRWLARLMARNQRREVRDMELARMRLGAGR